MAFLRHSFLFQVLVIIEVNPNKAELPTEAYIAVEEIREDGTPVRESFEHIPCSMGAEEAEEVGVEHLLRLVTFEALFSHCLQVNFFHIHRQLQCTCKC